MSGEVVATDDVHSDGEPAGTAGWLARRVRADESGLALVWMTLFLMVLLGFAAIAVDIGHGYQVAQRAQNTADAAALAGTVYLPGNVATAYSTAQTIASANGFTNSPVNGVQVIPEQQTKLSQLKVTVKQSVKTWFAKAIGFGTMDISRSAIADYAPPIAMGSPNPQYGNDPESGCAPASSSCTLYPNLWGNVSAHGSTKQSGDAYTSGDCGGTPDNCSGSNSDLDPNGYYYDVHFNSAATVKVQVFDPGFVAVGDFCEAGGQPSYYADLKTAALAAKPAGWPVGVTFNGSARYAPEGSTTDSPSTSNPGTRCCTGDQPFDAPGGVAQNMPSTTYTVLGPSALPGQPSTASPTVGCNQQVFPGVGGSPGKTIAQQLANGTKISVSPTPQYLAAYFRQWYTMCTITGAANSDYFLQINGDANGKGHNRFAIRASGGAAGAVSVYGNAKMAIYANAGSGVLTQFYLTRIPSNDQGHVLDLFLFDIGDAGSGVTGSLQVVAPTDATGAAIGPCTYTAPPGNSTGPPWGTDSLMSSCTISGVSSANYQGQWIEIKIPIPSSYGCLDSSPTGCWFRINYLFNGTVNDTTSWAAQLEGDPVRIVK
ncbi:MAG TPA: TadE/TadG family type IV pilus assembly protein [Acidimicrobiia bacterium]